MGFYFNTNSIMPTTGEGGGGGGSGTQITATNNTGAPISTGDKVFLAPPASSSVMVSGWDTLLHFVSADGSTVYYDNYRYDVATGDTTSGSEYPMSNDGGIVNGLRYTSLGMFAGPYQIVGLTLRVLDKIILSENYGFEYYQGSQLYWNLYELNPSDLSSYTFRHNCIFNYNVDCRQMRLVVIGNKLYASQSNLRWVGEITSGVTDITMNERTDSLYVLYATSDNKCAICCDTAGSYDGTWSGVKLYNSATEDFDTVDIVLSGQTASGYMMLTVTDDLSKAQYGNYLYTLTGGNYQAVSFANFTQAGYTGIATSDTDIGANVSVKTVLE